LGNIIAGDLYVIDFVQREVVVVRSKDKLEVIGRAPVGGGPSKMAIDPLTGNVYVANTNEHSATILEFE
jgi:DNA-binding beta-propeller fold protein YncE